MNFNYFRLFLTLLAAFGAFFAYICRLNLSLIMNKMVVAQDNVSIPTQQEIDGIAGQPQAFNRPESVIFTEEHAYDLISRSTRRYSQRFNSRNKRGNSSRKTTQPVTIRGRKLDQIAFLSVNFDKDNLDSKLSENDESTSAPEGTSSSAAEVVPVKDNLLNWSISQQNSLLGAFFLGYVIFQIPAGRAAEVLGAKLLFLIVGFGCGICSLLFPFASKYSDSIYYAYTIRVIMGGCQAGLFPAVYVFLCEWLPPLERSKWLPYPSAFSRFGTIVMNFTLPFVYELYDWEMVYYLTGAVTVFWSILFLIFASPSPSQSFWVSKDELMHIESHMEPRVGTLTKQTSITASDFTINESTSEKISLNRPSISWSKIISNKASLILSLVMFSSEWCNVILLVKLPSFLEDVFKMELKEVGQWSSFLIVIYCFQFPLSGYVASRLDNSDSKHLNSRKIRKIFEMLSQSMQGISCLIIAFSSDKTVVISALCLMMLGRGTVGGGQCLMPPELSKEYPGTVFAFTNTIANMAGIIGPEVVKIMVAKPKEHESWFNFYILSAAIFFTAGLVFWLFGDNRPQNLCKRPKANSTSRAQLTETKIRFDKPEEIFRMDAFSRVASQPSPHISELTKKIGA